MKQHRPDSEHQRARERALYLYGNALERGDFATVEAVLRQAETDPVLERMLAAWDETLLLQQAEADLTLEGTQKTNGKMPAPAFGQSDAVAVAIVRQQFLHYVEEHHMDMQIPPDETQDLLTEQPVGRGGRALAREAPAVPTRLYPRRARRIFTWTAATVAVLAVAIVSGALFVSHHSPTGGHPAPITSTSTPQPTAAPPSGVYINTFNGAPGSAPGKVYAFNPTDGSALWSANEPAGIHIAARPVLDHGTLYTLWEDLNNDTSGIVTAFDAKSGKQRWSVALRSVVDNVTLTLVDGVIYLGLRNGQVVALDASTGSIRWRTLTAADAMVALVADGAVYVEAVNSGLSSTLYALNASDGAVRWHFLRHAALGKVEVADGQVYFLTTGSSDNLPPSGASAASAACCQPQNATLPNAGGGNTILYLLDPANGSVRWSYGTSGNTLLDFEASNGVFLLFLDTRDQPAAPANFLEAHDARTHQVVWRLSVASDPTARIDSTAFLNGVLYVATNDTLYALNPSTGAHLWQIPMANGTICDAAFCPPDQGDTLYVGTSAHLYALHRSDGSLIWSAVVPAYSNVSAVSGQMVFLSLLTTINPQNGAAKSGFLVLSASDGTLLWHHDEDAASTGPVVG
jgi:outer membrane protein assembly factor BamB